MPVSAVVPGFSEALKLMAKGESLRVWIPSRLAYGAADQRDDQGKVVIPGNSTLVFDIELIDFQPQS
jgi:FKBP-type peptidyl-prolyl cis-trans isomerase